MSNAAKKSSKRIARKASSVNEEDLIRAANERRRAERLAEAERIEREGIQLRGPRLNHAQCLLSEMNLAGIAINELARAAASDPEAADGYMTAIENTAKTICRRLDIVSTYLGGGRFGSFQEDFEPLTEEQAAWIETREREQEAAEAHHA